MAREIPLTQGKVAIVDDEDFERLSRFKWYAVRQRGMEHIRDEISADDEGFITAAELPRVLGCLLPGQQSRSGHDRRQRVEQVQTRALIDLLGEIHVRSTGDVLRQPPGFRADNVRL